MSKRTYVCLDCRTAKRAEAAYGLNTDFRCSQCQGPAFELPWGWRIPKKTDGPGWKELRKFVSELEHDWIPRRNAAGESELAKLDAQIDATSRRKPSDARDKKLKYLRWRRRQIEKGYTEQESGHVRK